MSPNSLSSASEKCQQEKRKTVNGEDILFAMTSLGFENYGEALKIYLSRYRDVRPILRSHLSELEPVLNLGPEVCICSSHPPILSGSNSPSTHPRLHNISPDSTNLGRHTYPKANRTRQKRPQRAKQKQQRPQILKTTLSTKATKARPATSVMTAYTLASMSRNKETQSHPSYYRPTSPP